MTLRVIKRTQSVQTGMPDAEHRHDGVTPDNYRSSRSSMGMHFVTLRVIKRTQSVQNGMPTQSIGTMVLFLT
ncbi:hypothetical protein L6212_23605, partial [Pseudomonas syringae pv. syringae]|nr:hypothetical protein [Pseudomonas syringae pv. syringae]